MKTTACLLFALALSASAFSQTSAPAAPTLTAGAEFKGLRFDWEPVPGAAWYQLEYRAHANDPFVQQGDDLPATATSTHFSLPVHLFDWSYARYRLAACNSAGCSRSSAVIVASLRRDAVGYFKAGVSRPGGLFGDFIDLSPDGYNLVASAGGEVTRTSSGPVGGGVYVFRRGADGKWVQRVRFDAHGRGSESLPSRVYNSVAISGSGNTVAVSVQDNFTHGTQQWDGQVDVYHFKNGAWGRTRIPRPDVAIFGGGLQLSENGYVLVTGTGFGSDVAIYKSIDATWQNIYTSNFSAENSFCDTWKLSHDGRTLALLCVDSEDTGGFHPTPTKDYVRVLSGKNFSTRTDIPLDLAYGHSDLTVDDTANTIAVSFFHDSSSGPDTEGFVRVYQRDASGYHQTAQLDPGSWRPSSRKVTYGGALALSGDGHTLIVDDSYDNGAGLGPLPPPLVAGTAESGAAYVYRLTGSWQLVKVLKPNYYDSTQVGEFGRQIRVSRSGRTVAIGVDTEDSSASGIDGDWANSKSSNSGAVFMY